MIFFKLQFLLSHIKLLTHNPKVIIVSNKSFRAPAINNLTSINDESQSFIMYHVSPNAQHNKLLRVYKLKNYWIDITWPYVYQRDMLTADKWVSRLHQIRMARSN